MREISRDRDSSSNTVLEPINWSQSISSSNVPWVRLAVADKALSLSPVELEPQKISSEASIISRDNLLSKAAESFRRRALTDGLPQEEVTLTLHNVERVLTSKKLAIPESERKNLAVQILEHAAHPQAIDQGYHQTCATTALEHILFTRQPSKAAELIATTAIDGQWIASDGKVIALPADSFVPGVESKSFHLQGSSRSFASQLFQLTAINDMSQRNELDSALYRRPLMYHQRYSPHAEDPSLDYLTEMDGTTAVRINGKRQAGFGIYALTAQGELARLSGRPATMIANWKLERSEKPTVKTPRTLAEFQSVLSEAHRVIAFPALLLVNANQPPFHASGSPKKGEIAGHLVSIDKYDPLTKKVYLDNQWGRDKDHWFSSSEIWNATEPNPEPTIENLHNLVDLLKSPRPLMLRQIESWFDEVLSEPSRQRLFMDDLEPLRLATKNRIDREQGFHTNTASVLRRYLKKLE